MTEVFEKVELLGVREVRIPQEICCEWLEKLQPFVFFSGWRCTYYEVSKKSSPSSLSADLSARRRPNIISWRCTPAFVCTLTTGALSTWRLLVLVFVVGGCWRLVGWLGLAGGLVCFCRLLPGREVQAGPSPTMPGKETTSDVWKPFGSANTKRRNIITLQYSHCLIASYSY